MTTENDAKRRDSTRFVIEPPTFSPPPEMRKSYLERHKAELDMMLDSAKNGEWKPVVNIGNHVRGTGAMYGFPNMGAAAEELIKAVQNGDANSLEYLEAYARAVRESYV